MGIALPGTVVQRAANASGAVATGTTIVPGDDTIPQNTEGDQYMSQAITPTSAANVLRISHQGSYSYSAANNQLATGLFQDSTANALAVSTQNYGSAANYMTGIVNYAMVAGTVSSTTMKIRAGGQSAGTTSFNGNSGARQYGGVLDSYLEILEIAA